MKTEYEVKSKFKYNKEVPQDMLRYDHVEIIGETSDGWTIVGSDHPCAKRTEGRWNSFGFMVRNKGWKCFTCKTDFRTKEEFYKHLKEKGHRGYTI